MFKFYPRESFLGYGYIPTYTIWSLGEEREERKGGKKGAVSEGNYKLRFCCMPNCVQQNIDPNVKLCDVTILCFLQMMISLGEKRYPNLCGPV